MKIAGIVAEYNPFHKGHAWHIAQTRAQTKCDYVVVCMAGSFTQRGQAACRSKWTRAQMALTCGADAVFELPALFAVRTADAFARGGVAVLNGIGADILSFGSESTDLELLERLAALRLHEPETLSDAIQCKLAQGMSHARARGEALSEYLGVAYEKLNAPNTILGAEYIRAIREMDLRLQPFAVQRWGSYHEFALPQEDQMIAGSGFASATAIRAAMADGRWEEALVCVPEAVRPLLKHGETMHAPDDLLLYRLRMMSEAEIAALPDVTEGLEKRVKRIAQEVATQTEFIERLKCKRYTWARLSRLTAHVLLDLTDALTRRHPLPEYARLIGMREDARPLLKELKTRATLPIISDATKLAGNEIFQLECRATDLRALQCAGVEARRAGQDFTRKFIRV